MPLTDDQKRRYARHLVLPEVGEAGQEKLLASSALVIGAGGLGSSALMALAAAGVGRLGIIEHDRLELSNLQRQVMYEEADLGRAKIDAAADRLHELNPALELALFPRRLTPENARERVQGFDVVLDGSDNFATRFALADACAHEKIPLVSAAISGFQAQLSTFTPYLGAPHPCYRCLVPEKPEREITCAQEGIIGPLAPLMGSWQALEALRVLLGMATLSGQLLRLDARQMQPRLSLLPKDPACGHCRP
jgi:molybdopterin/thiamine biosynthesis adenylyltransferase